MSSDNKKYKVAQAKLWVKTSLSVIRRQIEHFFTLHSVSEKGICLACKRQKKEVCIDCFYNYSLQQVADIFRSSFSEYTQTYMDLHTEAQKKLLNEKLKVWIYEAVASAFS